MTFAEKLKNCRSRAGLSQEKLAEKLGVSRQAITKWESGAGIPDIENIMAISALFDISIDDLLSNKKETKASDDYLYESVTEYDIDELKHFDMKLGWAKKLVISGWDSEKIRIRLASDTLPSLQNDFKVKIDDTRRHIDAEVVRKNGAAETAAKEALNIYVQIPSVFTDEIECEINAQSVEIRNVNCDSLELDAKTPKLILEDVVGPTEINCNLDMEIICRTLNGDVSLNQLSALSRIYIPEDAGFTAVTKGIGTSVSYEKDGKACEPFGAPDSENIIELNGIKSALVICSSHDMN